MPTCSFEAVPFESMQRQLVLNGASKVDVRLATLSATIVTVILFDGDPESPVAKKVLPTTGVNDVAMTFDLEAFEKLTCEVRVDAEQGSTKVQVQVDY